MLSVKLHFFTQTQIIGNYLCVYMWIYIHNKAVSLAPFSLTN